MKLVFKACTSNHTAESEQESVWVVPYLCLSSSFDIDDNILQEGVIAVFPEFPCSICVNLL